MYFNNFANWCMLLSCTYVYLIFFLGSIFTLPLSCQAWLKVWIYVLFVFDLSSWFWVDVCLYSMYGNQCWNSFFFKFFYCPWCCMSLATFLVLLGVKLGSYMLFELLCYLEFYIVCDLQLPFQVAIQCQMQVLWCLCLQDSHFCPTLVLIILLVLIALHKIIMLSH